MAGVTLGEVECIAETDGAVLVKGECVAEHEDSDEVWIPKSQLHDDSEVYGKGHTGKVIVKKWLAEQRGWT